MRENKKMAKNLMYVFGAMFIILGVLGFVYNPLLGLFTTNYAHNLVHVVSGILSFVFASRGESAPRSFALILGVIYLLLTVFGFMQGSGNLFGIVAINGADNFLHLLFAVLFLGVGLTKPSNAMSPASASYR